MFLDIFLSKDPPIPSLDRVCLTSFLLHRVAWYLFNVAMALKSRNIYKEKKKTLGVFSVFHYYYLFILKIRLQGRGQTYCSFFVYIFCGFRKEL